MQTTIVERADAVGPVRVLLVDDHPLVRASVRSCLEATPDLRVVGEAADGGEAVHLAACLLPDVVVMDLVMPGTDGVEATRRLTACLREVQVLVLTSSAAGDRVRDALAAGAVGYLLKDADPDVIVDGVRRVVRGESPLDPRAVRAMLEQSRRSRQSWLVGGRPLTGRQVEVLRCLEAGMTNPQIADALGIRPRTVKVHVGDILQHLGVRDREAAARRALGSRGSSHVA